MLGHAFHLVKYSVFARLHLLANNLSRKATRQKKQPKIDKKLIRNGPKSMLFWSGKPPESQDSPRQTQKWSKSVPRCSKSVPRATQERAKSAPRAIQDPPRAKKGAATGGKWWQTMAQGLRSEECWQPSGGGGRQAPTLDKLRSWDFTRRPQGRRIIYSDRCAVTAAP